uniref:uncharacterized protein LOC120348031 n=1 Tax=Styela clava TaxID=7725 RepID=UPI00193ABF80|nr:uncharacterized protein LOC120348031 [Styela clava]
MKSYFIIIVIIFISSSLCQDVVLQCSAKPGCRFVQCDPTPLRWDQPGISIENHLRRNEFPITCRTQKAAQFQSNANLLPLITGNIQDIRSINSDLNEIERKVDGNAVKIKEIASSDKKSKSQINGITENSQKIQQQSFEISELREANNKQKLEISTLSSKLSHLHKTNSDQKLELGELRETNKKQSSEISALGKENSKRSSEINALIKEMASLERKVADINSKCCNSASSSSHASGSSGFRVVGAASSTSSAGGIVRTVTSVSRGTSGRASSTRRML